MASAQVSTPSFAGAVSWWRRGVTRGLGMAVDFGSGEGIAELGHVGIGKSLYNPLNYEHRNT
jgi:hypothetical protein